MGKELDRRDYTVNRATEPRKRNAEATASSVSATLPGAERVRVESLDAVTGNPAVIASESAPAEKGNYVQRAVSHLNRIHRVMGLTEGQAPEFAPDHNVQEASSGAVTVHYQQRYKGIPIFQATGAVRFAPNGAILETVGKPAAVGAETSVEPRITAAQAVQSAARHCTAPDPDSHGKTDAFGEPLDQAYPDAGGYEPRMTTRIASSPQQHTVFEQGPFADAVKASLLWFSMGDELRLTWEVLLSMPGYAAQYRTLVDAQSGEILYCKQLVRHVLARGNVFRVDGGGQRQMTDFPRPLQDYGLPVPGNLPNGFPDHWVSDNQTAGNCARAHLDANGPSAMGSMNAGVLTFDPANPNGDDQKVVNLFYLNGFIHDFFYLLGFREADGNFQSNNLGRGGAQADSVDARVFSGAVTGTATMGTGPDGSSPRMTMGLVTSTNRHSALDSGVVFHEFTHGVTNRLVGGPLNTSALEEPQSGGMGEGWGDYIACCINNTEVVGAWLVNRPGGIRAFPYNSSFPDHFGKIGTGRFDEEHNIGEIWCATLMEMNRKIGKSLALQLVVDALKLSPANPGFLDMRDAIHKALDLKQSAGQLSSEEHSRVKKGVWEAFAKFGMGPAARSNGASLSGIAADFNVPRADGQSSVRANASPNLAIPDNQPAGVTSTVQIAEAGRANRISVAVDIAHTFSGDLRVILRTPSGRQAVLSDRAGGNRPNIAATFTSEGLPELQALTGESIQGTWTLSVSDVAASDTGVLRNWSIELGVDAASQTVRRESAPGLSIPDNDANGIADTIAIAQTGTAQRVVADLDITHSFIGDLKVELTSPGGQTAVLHDVSQDGSDNLIVTVEAAALAGQQVQGNWTLRVRDLAAQDEGKLNRWSLQLQM